MKEFALIIGEKLNRFNGQMYVLIPLKGWSEIDKPEMEFFDPETNKIFLKELKKILNPKIPVEEIDLHISDYEFAQRAVEVLDKMIKTNK